MKSMTMKSTLLTCALIGYSLITHAQDVFSNKTNTALEKVIKDYPNRFKNIKGEVLEQTPRSTEYRSTIQVAGSSSCIVTRISAAKNEAYSWDCTAFATQNFDQAKIKFKEIYDQIENTIIKIEGQKAFILSGRYSTPSQEKVQTSINFELLPATETMKKLRIDLVFQQVLGKWTISLRVYDHDYAEDASTAVVSN